MRHLQVHAVERFGLRARRVPQAKRWLGERRRDPRALDGD